MLQPTVGEPTAMALGFKYFRHDFILIGLGNIEDLDDCIRALGMDFRSDLVGNGFCAVPHGIVGNGNLVFLVGISPLGVFSTICKGSVRQIAPWDGAIIPMGRLSLPISSSFFVKMGAKGLRMLAKYFMASRFRRHWSALSLNSSSTA